MIEYSPEDLSNYRLQKAKETIHEVEKHLENKFWNTAINRMYYACFYAVGALLIKHGIHTSSHKGARQKFGQYFVKTDKVNRSLAKHYADLFVKRSKGDYNDFFDHDEETAIGLLPLTKHFIKKIEELIDE
jgi:uncharacterized protein (UPF0332 family)